MRSKVPLSPGWEVSVESPVRDTKGKYLHPADRRFVSSRESREGSPPTK